MNKNISSRCSKDERITTILMFALTSLFLSFSFSYKPDFRTLGNLKNIDDNYYTLNIRNDIEVGMSIIIKECNLNMDRFKIIDRPKTIVFYCNNTEFINKQFIEDENYSHIDYDRLYFLLTCTFLGLLSMGIIIFKFF